MFSKKIEKFCQNYKVKSLSDLDFSEIRRHIDAYKEEKRNRPAEAKKKEAEDRQKANAAYMHCIFDGTVEKVANFNIEPPGIFRGRGEHPHAGKIKSRIVPEYVTINVGYDDPIPACPVAGHSWKRVVNNTDATWLC
jgi:DNA topoisomerase-1